jgi:hypothetical protein
MNRSQRYCFILETVFLNSTSTIGYSYPDNLTEDEYKQLTNAIESNKELKLIILGDSSRGEAKKASAETIWKMLEEYPIGQHLIKAYPGIEKYRISSASAASTFFKPAPGEKLEDTDFYRFDKWANGQTRELATTMPSFREYIGDPNKFLPNVRSGAATKSGPMK